MYLQQDRKELRASDCKIKIEKFKGEPKRALAISTEKERMATPSLIYIKTGKICQEKSCNLLDHLFG